MTDQEVICAFMEPKPPDGTSPQNVSESGWWKAVYVPKLRNWRWFPDDDKYESLDALHEVEARLTDEQWTKYRREWCLIAWDEVERAGLAKRPANLALTRGELLNMALHTTAEQKIAALARVLREGA